MDWQRFQKYDVFNDLLTAAAASPEAQACIAHQLHNFPTARAAGHCFHQKSLSLSVLPVLDWLDISLLYLQGCVACMPAALQAVLYPCNLPQ